MYSKNVLNIVSGMCAFFLVPFLDNIFYYMASFMHLSVVSVITYGFWIFNTL